MNSRKIICYGRCWATCHPAVNPADGHTARLSRRGRRAGRPERSQRADLHQVTGGNPFYVREILEAGWPSIPSTVRDAVRCPPGRANIRAGDRGGRSGHRQPGGPDPARAAAADGPGGRSGRLPGHRDSRADGAALRFRHGAGPDGSRSRYLAHSHAELHDGCWPARAAGRRRSGAAGSLREGAGDAAACSGTPRRPPAAPPPRCPPRGRPRSTCGPCGHRRQRPGCGGRPARGGGRGVRLPDGGRTTSGLAHPLALRASRAT